MFNYLAHRFNYFRLWLNNVHDDLSPHTCKMLELILFHLAPRLNRRDPRHHEQGTSPGL